MATFQLKSRAVILKDNKIFLTREVKSQKFFLPGWTHEQWESIRECFIREIKEELWVTPVIEKMIAVREFHTPKRDVLDFWFLVKNVEDFENIDKSKCTHWFEWTESWFYDLDKLDEIDVLPKDLKGIIEEAKNNVYVDLV